MIIDWSLATSVGEWIKKYHNGYLVVGWGLIIDEYYIVDEKEKYILLRFGIEPNNIKGN